MSEIGIITNPHSKLNKQNPNRSKLLSYIAGERGKLEITNNLEELSEAAHHFKEKKIQILAINGGDGTISRTLTAFIRAYGSTPLPPVAILGGGTINVLAKNLSIKGTPEGNLYKLVENYSTDLSPKVTTLNTLQIEDNYGFLFANGTSASFLELFYRNKTNALGSIMLVFKLAASYLFRTQLYRQTIKKVPYRLKLDKHNWFHHQSCSILCSTFKMMPFGVPFFPDATSSSNKFQLVSMLMDAQKLAFRLIPTAFLAPDKPAKDKMLTTCNQCTIESPSDRLYTLDGELFQLDKSVLNIQLGPKIQFVHI